MIKVTVRIEIEHETPQSLNHLDIVSRDCENVLRQFRPLSIQRIDCNVLGPSLAGTHRKIVATFPCQRAKCDIKITEK